MKSLLFAFGLAIFLVYLVMASQFESLLHPFVILFTIPLAMVGAAGPADDRQADLGGGVHRPDFCWWAW